MHEAAARALFERDTAFLTPRFLKARRWYVHDRSFPVLDLSFQHETHPELRLRICAQDWNARPPSIELLDSTGSRIPVNGAPRDTVFHQGPHPKTGLPFVCKPGTFEYHTHDSHLNDHWENYRGKDAYTLGALLDQIWHAWLVAPR